MTHLIKFIRYFTVEEYSEFYKTMVDNFGKSVILLDGGYTTKAWTVFQATGDGNVSVYGVTFREEGDAILFQLKFGGD